MTVAHRAAEPEDMRFIVDAWVRSYRDADTAGFIQVDRWFAVMIPEITAAVRKPDVRTLVAYETSDADRFADLYGFLVADVEERPPLVYYCYVKEPYRQQGIARGLFRAMGIDPARPFNYVCSTPMSGKLSRERKIPLARWLPKLGRYPKAERQGRQERP